MEFLNQLESSASVSYKTSFCCLKRKVKLLVLFHCRDQDDSGSPWMEAFNTEWDGFHCLAHSVVHMTPFPLTPTFLNPSVPIPFRLQRTHTHTITHILVTPQQQCMLSPNSGKWHNCASADWHLSELACMMQHVSVFLLYQWMLFSL